MTLCTMIVFIPILLGFYLLQTSQNSVFVGITFSYTCDNETVKEEIGGIPPFKKLDRKYRVACNELLVRLNPQ